MKILILVSILCVSLFSWDFNYNELTENETKLKTLDLQIEEQRNDKSKLINQIVYLNLLAQSPMLLSLSRRLCLDN